MQSKITIKLIKDQPIETKKNEPVPLNFERLRTAGNKTFVLDKGYLSVQSISHYLAHIELFECSFTQRTSIEFTVNAPAFFMYADLQKGVAHLCYHPAGKYRKTVAAGSNQVMLLTFRSDWLIHKCKKLSALSSFTGLFCNPEDQPMHLPRVNITGSLMKALIKMDTAANDMHMDDDGYTFINGCINKYYNKLKCKNATIHYHHHKASDLSAFIHSNFATEEVENLPKLAARFMVSERSLARLAKMAFGIPLHEQVIKLRVHYALDLLLNTEKPIYEIAALSGYKESYYFSKAFKKHFGACPKSITRASKALVLTSLKLQT